MKTKTSARNFETGVRSTLVGLVSLLLLSACSSVPDAVNPVEWYRSTVDAVSGDSTKKAEASSDEKQVPGEKDGFPKLSDVPERPTDANIKNGLIADPNAPKYAPSVALQGEDNSTGVVVADQASEAPAVPVEPVQESSNDTASQSSSQSSDTAAAMPEPGATPPAEPTVSADSNSNAGSTAGQVQQSDLMASMAPAQPTVSQPLTIVPGRLPSGETYDDYRQRLMKGLDQAGTSSFRPTTGFTSVSAGSSLGTIVVSSQGVEQQAGSASALDVTSDGISDAGFRRIVGDDNLLGSRSVKVATIQFRNGSDSLDSRDIYVLRQVAALYAKKGGIVRVIGHASSWTQNMDEVRHKLVNYRVSSERADAVATALTRLGLPKKSIVVGAASDSEPVYKEVMPTGEAGNRRAEIYIDS